MSKRTNAGGHAGDNAASDENSEPPRPWTAEEMAAAKPLPLPEVGPASPATGPGVPHVGRGETLPSGRPDEAKR